MLVCEAEFAKAQVRMTLPACMRDIRSACLLQLYTYTVYTHPFGPKKTGVAPEVTLGIISYKPTSMQVRDPP